jgi:hypothetical protein
LESLSDTIQGEGSLKFWDEFKCWAATNGIEAQKLRYDNFEITGRGMSAVDDIQVDRIFSIIRESSTERGNFGLCTAHFIVYNLLCRD